MKSKRNMNEAQCRQKIEQWLESAVIGLNLCPFARKPFVEGRVRIYLEMSNELDDFFTTLMLELQKISAEDVEETETTVLVTPNLFKDFNAYLDGLDVANELLESQDYAGIIQIASFHPDYQFEGEDKDAASNFTNRSPYPVFHLIREASLSDMLARFPDSDRIPENNIKLMEEMETSELRKRFPWGFSRDT